MLAQRKKSFQAKWDGVKTSKDWLKEKCPFQVEFCLFLYGFGQRNMFLDVSNDQHSSWMI